MANQDEYGVFKRVGKFGEVGSHFIFEPGSKPLPPDSQAATFHRLVEECGSLAFLLDDPPPCT